MKTVIRLQLLALVLASALNAQQIDTAAVATYVRAEMTRQKIPGVAVAVVQRGRVAMARGFGVANVEHAVPATAETMFQSGSVGKQFTSAAVMLMVEDGKLVLDDAIAKHFTDAPAAWRNITVRHLLTHTSGIPDYTIDAFDYRRDYTEAELTKLAYEQALEFPPGSRWNYSNTGYVLLGILVHKVSGQFYGDVLRERVFAPLGMTTARIISEADIVPHRAAGYRVVNGKLENQEWVAPKLNTTADGSLYLSLRDMIAWDRGLRTDAVLQKSSWQAIRTPARLTSGNAYPYGFGWAIDTIAGQLVQSHGGSWQGFKSFIGRYLGDDFTVIVFANLAQANPELIGRGVAAVIDPSLKRPELKLIADDQPAITQRLLEVLSALKENRLQPSDFAYVRAGFFPRAAERYAQLLRAQSAPSQPVLLQRRQVGDDRISIYDVAFGATVLRVSFALAPDGKIAAFAMQARN